jgi:hypothetical protein
MDFNIDRSVSPEVDAQALFDMATKGEAWISIVAPHFWEKKWLEICQKLVSLAPEHALTFLKESMQHIPKEWGQLVRAFYGKGDQLIILLQDNYFNWKARLNQAHMLKAMTYTHCVKLVASAGASGEVDTSSVSSFPDRDVRLQTAFMFLKSLELTAEEFCQIVDNSNFIIWGIEDKQLYLEQLKLNAEQRTTEMLKLHKDVPAVYVHNTLKKMKEIKKSVAILTTGAYDMLNVSKELNKKNISFFWIKAAAEGPDSEEEYNRLLLDKRRSISDLLQESKDEKLPEF